MTNYGACFFASLTTIFWGVAWAVPLTRCYTILQQMFFFKGYYILYHVHICVEFYLIHGFYKTEESRGHAAVLPQLSQ